MGDAANTAIAYGAVTQAVNLLFPILSKAKNFNVPKSTDVDIQADFLSEASEIDISISFSLRVWHLFHVAFAALGTFIKHQIKKFGRSDQVPKGHKVPTSETKNINNK